MYTVSKFHNLMSSLGNYIYMLKMTQQKLQERYGDSMKLVTRDRKSNTILLERVEDISSKQWYNEGTANVSDESEHVIRTAAKILREGIKNNKHETDFYPSAYDIMSK